MRLRFPLMFGCAVMALMALSTPMMMGGLEGLAPLIPVAMIWTGLVLAIRLRPSLADILAERRAPTASEGGALVIAMVGALMTFSTIAIGAAFALRLLSARGLGVEEVAAPLFQLVWLVLPVAPLWARIVHGPEAADEPLRPPGTASVWLSGVPSGA